jgi:hypothetical protein
MAGAYSRDPNLTVKTEERNEPFFGVEVESLSGKKRQKHK